MAYYLLSYYLLWSLIVIRVFVKADTFDEQLIVRPLEDGRVLTHFQFVVRTSERTTSTATTPPLSGHNDYLFSPAMAQIIDKYKVTSLRLSLTQGTWMPERWDYPVVGEESAGSGAELWAQLQTDSQLESVDQRWRGLTHALAGVFCASLNFIDDTHTVAPQLAFKQEAGSGLRYGLLPRESVCTENLTPWIKQLPCQSKAGLANLLNTHRIYKANYHSMIIHVQHTANGLELRQTVVSVLEPTQQEQEQEQGWSLWASLERYLPKACPLARQSRFVINLLEDEQQVRATVEPTETIKVDEQRWAIYDLIKEQRSDLNVGYLYGFSADHGSLAFELKNRATSNARVSLLQVTPWYMNLFMHTLDIELVETSSVNQSDILQQWYYQPAADRRRSTLLELQLNLPAQSTIRLNISFRKLFLRYTEYPPDANHGFDIGPAVLTMYNNNTDNDNVYYRHLEGGRFYTTPFLLNSPLPDFSMPYNVITLTCTIIALFFGSMFNLLSRNFEPIRWHKKEKQ
ncbi:GPI transamidase component PIG-T [Syncephalis plumigaleata]|nr:GPI transamidase component PIG-T [Syncephalis plumigaleata]